MPDFHVTWEIELEADTPKDAARKARDMQLDPAAWVDSFTVVDEGGDIHDVNLADNEPK
jgi:hypothetical protein